MKKIVLFTAILALVASTSIAVSSFLSTEMVSLNSSTVTELVNDQGEKTKEKDAKKETAEEAGTKEKSCSKSCKKSCSKSCKKSCDDKSKSKSKE